MALPQHQLQLSFQPHPHKNLRNLYEMDGQISQQQQPLPYFNASAAFPDPHHPPYVPPFHVVGFAPGPGPGPADASEKVVAAAAAIDLGWNYGGLPAAEHEPQVKRSKEEQDLFFTTAATTTTNNNNSPVSSIDFLHPRSVSTGLGLSLDNNSNHCGNNYGARPSLSWGDNNSALMFSLVGDEVDRELQRQDAEIDRFLKDQGDRLRQTVLDKVQASQLQAISLVEAKILQKLREKEAEMETINRKNMELEERMEQLSVEAGTWQQRARYNESMMTALKLNLQQVYAQSRDSKEGCGDSEVDDTASCCNGRGIDFHLLGKENYEMKKLMTCKVCRAKEVCMLLIPCKHLCLCKDCESKLSFCPLCQTSKFLGMEVYM